MAVVKIVPMPGVAVVGPEGPQGPRGYQGETGLTGAQGPAGVNGTNGINGTNGTNGTNGADFDSTNGLVVTGFIDDPVLNPAGTMSLNVGPGYAAIMDLSAHSATFNGDVQITNLSGTRVTTIETPTTINNELSIQTEYGEGWTFDNNGYILGPWLSAAEDPGNTGRYLRVNGITRADNNPLLVSSSGPILINGTNGEFLNFHGDPNNQIATIGDLTTPTSGTWNVNLNTSTYTYEESSRSSKTFAEYYLVGDLVHFDMNYCFENQTDGGFGYLLFDLPFLAKNHSNNILFTGVRYETEDPLIATGQVVIWGRTRETHPATGASGAWVEINYEDPSSGMSLTQGLQHLPINSIRFSGVYRKA